MSSVAANCVGQAPWSPLWASSRLPIAIRPFWSGLPVRLCSSVAA